MLAFFNAWRKLRVELSNVSKELEQAKSQVEESTPQIMLEARSITSNDPNTITVRDLGKTPAYNIRIEELSNKDFTAVFDEIPYVEAGGYAEVRIRVGKTGTNVLDPTFTLDWFLRQGWHDVSIVYKDFPLAVSFEDIDSRLLHKDFMLRYTFHPRKVEIFRKSKPS